MVIPRNIEETSPLDPLLLLPLPSKLPQNPLEGIDPLLRGVEESLNGGERSIPITSLTAQLRQISRHAYILLNAARAGAAGARESLDLVDVDLRGVEYERNRVLEEIAKCEDYNPVYKGMEMPDVEAFLSTASEATLAALPESTDESYEHALSIARLEYQLAQIEEREATLARLTKERDAIIKSNKEIKMKFASTDSYLADFAKSTQAMAKKIDSVAQTSS